MTAVDNRAAWWSRAACSTADPERFFPISAAGPALRQVAHAKAICARCPIRQACLDYALSAGAIQGVWGGTTEVERRTLRRRRRRARRAPQSTPQEQVAGARLAGHALSS